MNQIMLPQRVTAKYIQEHYQIGRWLLNELVQSGKVRKYQIEGRRKVTYDHKQILNIQKPIHA